MLKGLSGLGDMAKLMKQAKEMQERLGELTCVGESGAGLVKATVSGNGHVKRIEIDPSLFIPEDREVVEDLIVAAINEGQARTKEAMEKEIGNAANGLGLPKGMGFPF